MSKDNFAKIKYTEKFSKKYPIVKDCKINNISSKCTETEKTLYKIEKVELFFNRRQKYLIKKWIDLYRKTYNKAIKIAKKHNEYNFYRLRKMVQPFYDENNRKRIGMGKNTLDGAVKDVCVAYKSAKAKLEAGNIKKFRLRPKKKCSNKETIVIGHGAFSNKSTKKRRNSFAYRKLGEIKSSVPFIDNTREARLTFDKRRNKFYLFIVKETRVFKVDDRQKECSLDPGLRMFQTCYDKKKCFSFGENIKGFVEPILKKIDRIDNFQNKFWYKKYTQRLRDKIRNKIDNIHWNICKILVTRYNEITIGKLSTKIVSKKGFMTKMNKRLYYALSHYTFRQRLKFKCQEYGVKFNEQNESYTTKKCGGCGKLNEVGTAKVFNCVFCDFTWGRDQNGARNIMIRKDLGL